MGRSSPRRGQRSKGFKVKHCLQFTLLLDVGIWLLYQLKHSHDDKKAVFDESVAKVVVEKENHVVKLGRKDLNPRVEESSKNEEILDRERGEEERNNDKEAEGTGSEESENVTDDESEGGGETSNEEAREKNYKGDDASSEFWGLHLPSPFPSAVMLTDIVFWGLIYPFTKGYRLSFLHVCMHSLNAVFLLGDTCLNSLVTLHKLVCGYMSLLIL